MKLDEFLNTHDKTPTNKLKHLEFKTGIRKRILEIKKELSLTLNDFQLSQTYLKKPEILEDLKTLNALFKEFKTLIIKYQKKK